MVRNVFSYDRMCSLTIECVLSVPGARIFEAFQLFDLDGDGVVDYHDVAAGLHRLMLQPRVKISEEDWRCLLVCMHACMYACILTCMHACMHACMHTYIHA